MKRYWDSGGTAPHILNLSIRWKWVVSFVPWPLYPSGKSPWYILDSRLGGSQSWSGCDTTASTWTPVIQPVVLSLYQLSCPKSIYENPQFNTEIHKSTMPLTDMYSYQNYICLTTLSVHIPYHISSVKWFGRCNTWIDGCDLPIMHSLMHWMHKTYKKH
jgi:hypothetical protein